MKLKLLFTVHAFLALFFGIGFMFMPGMVAGTMLLPTAYSATIGWRYFGIMILAIGICVWFARNTGDSEARRAIVKMCIAAYGIMTVYHLASLIMKAIPASPMLISVMALHTAFCVLYAMFLRRDIKKGKAD